MIGGRYHILYIPVIEYGYILINMAYGVSLTEGIFDLIVVDFEQKNNIVNI